MGPALLDALEHGVDVSVVEFEDMDQVMIWTVAAHDADNNRYKATSLRDLVETVERFRQKVPGGDWKATQALQHPASSMLGARHQNQSCVWASLVAVAVAVRFTTHVHLYWVGAQKDALGFNFEHCSCPQS